MKFFQTPVRLRIVSKAAVKRALASDYQSPDVASISCRWSGQWEGNAVQSHRGGLWVHTSLSGRPAPAGGGEGHTRGAGGAGDHEAGEACASSEWLHATCVVYAKKYYRFFALLNSQEVTVRLLKEAILSSPGSEGFLIDGFPRELSQGKIFIEQVHTQINVSTE